jgi:hypothetical protein
MFMIKAAVLPRRSGMARAFWRAGLPLVVLAVLAGCGGPTRPGRAGPVTAADIAGDKLVAQTSPEIHKIETLGRTIYILDNAAARATDRALADGADLVAADVRGWITDTTGPGVLVRFVRQRGSRVEAAYDIRVDERGQASAMTHPANPALTPEQSAQFAARQLALAQNGRLCPGSYNPVAFRDADTSDWRVYLLVGTSDPDVQVIAGHQRVIVSPDGKRVLSVQNLSRTCQAPRVKAPPGNTLAVSFLTEVQSPIPTETHVFSNLLYRLPLVIMTAPNQTWIVDQGRIWGVRQ